MSFDTGNKYILDYLDKKKDQIKNNTRPAWFSTELSKMSDITEKFDRKEENNRVEKMLKEPEDFSATYRKAVLKRDWLIAIYRDLRMQYLSGKEDRNKLPQDATRYQYLSTRWNNLALTDFVDRLKEQEV